MSATLPVIQSSPVSNAVQFHLSLNVDDLERSTKFFSLLFDQPAAKQQSDYVKFELAEPPLVISLEPNRTPRGGKLNHLGFRVANVETLVALQRRLELSGISTAREEGVECCYARQTKFWVTDPDGNLWEIYTVESDIEHRGAGQRPQPASDHAGPTQMDHAEGQQKTPSRWAHRLGERFPERILAETAGVDEVLLQGTLNARWSPEQCQACLAEVFRILRPGGRIELHQLTADQTVGRLDQPLPGPAAVIEAVPMPQALCEALVVAGFCQLQFEKLSEAPNFSADGVDYREVKLVAFKPSEVSVASGEFFALYKGPFRQVEDDQGRIYCRGVWTKLAADVWPSFADTYFAESFVIRR